MAKDRLFEVLERYEAVIGLEIHTEITATDTKMFCGCEVAFGKGPNSRVCPVCLGLPGALPVPNKAAVEWTVLAGLATDCSIARHSMFHRKNYFYPDMPKDYQISQYDLPFCVDGHVFIDVDEEGVAERLDKDTAENVEVTPDGYRAQIGITRIHLEEDTAKMIHVGGTEGRIAGATKSLVDFNRAGTPLMELVSEPDLRTPEEARRFAQKLRLLWLSLGVSDCSMEEGSMRVDANISIRKRGETELGTKAELKNINSFKTLHDGLAYEIVRQADVLDGGGTVIQETRHYDNAAKVTSTLRSKEEAHDYRYFPEPDMVPFEFTEEFVASIEARLPELPDARKARFIKEYGLPNFDAGVLTSDHDMVTFYEQAVVACSPKLAKAVSNLILNDYSAYLNASGLGVLETKVTPAHIGQLVTLVDDGTISSKQAKEVFLSMAESGKMPAAVVEEKGMKQVSDSGAIEDVVDTIMAANLDKVEEYRGGKQGLIGFFVGQVMREMHGQGNPQVINEVLRRKLQG